MNTAIYTLYGCVPCSVCSHACIIMGSWMDGHLYFLAQIGCYIPLCMSTCLSAASKPAEHSWCSHTHTYNALPSYNRSSPAAVANAGTASGLATSQAAGSLGFAQADGCASDDEGGSPLSALLHQATEAFVAALGLEVPGPGASSATADEPGAEAGPQLGDGSSAKLMSPSKEDIRACYRWSLQKTC